MKKIFLPLIIIVSLFVFVKVAGAVKPNPNLAAAQKVNWNLSGAVMPVPPWGLSDITGSDTASKLIVNQPNGNTEVTITGAMNGLNPNTEYTVYLSNGWSTSEKWNIEGNWSLSFIYGGAYNHDMTVSLQNMLDGKFSGQGNYVTDPSYTWDIQSTSYVTGNTVYLDFIYTGSNAGYTISAVGTIDPNGYIVDGNWSNPSQNGTWSSTTGRAIKQTVGNGWPGLFNTQQTFTFMTDQYGAGSWHLNLKDTDFLGTGSYPLSVWINGGGGTILVSDNFTVVK